MSYNPATGLAYIPYLEMAGEYDKQGVDRERWRAREFVLNSGFQPYRKDISVADTSGALLGWDVQRQRVAAAVGGAPPDRHADHRR